VGSFKEENNVIFNVSFVFRGNKDLHQKLLIYDKWTLLITLASIRDISYCEKGAVEGD